jgi:hypothetical protein
MKSRILSVDLELENDQITNADFTRAPSFHDFDVVLVDPDAVFNLFFEKAKLTEVKDAFLTLEYDDKGSNKLIKRLIDQRKKETKHFLSLGRLLICILRAPFSAYLCSHGRDWPNPQKKDNWVNTYSWFPLQHSLDDMIVILSKEKGEKIKLVDHKSSFAEYFDAFDRQLHYVACLDEKQKPHYFKNFHTIAKTHGELPVAFNFELEGGEVVFLPPAEDPNPKKLAGVLLDCISATMGTFEETTPPSWVSDYKVFLPNLPELEVETEKLHKKISELQELLSTSEQQKAEQQKYLKLLYEQGRFQLEPVVRDAFSLFGFNVKDAEPSDGLLESDEGVALLEIEGKDDKAINIDKYSKLLNYVINDEAQTRAPRKKGILIGNGFRLSDLKDREQQFTKEVIGAAKNTGFCLLTTQILFDLVCKVLADPDNDDLKEEIRKQILSTDGLFRLENESE